MTDDLKKRQDSLVANGDMCFLLDCNTKLQLCELHHGFHMSQYGWDTSLSSREIF